MPRTGKRGKYKLRALSEKQKKMFNYLMEFIHDNGYPPSIREVGDEVDIESTSVVNYNLNKLVEHGLIARKKEVSRAIKLNLARARELGFNVEANLARARELGLDAADQKMLSVPVLGNIVASNPVDVGEVDTWESAEERINVATDLVGNAHDDVFALRVAGDSMIDANIQDNDLVVMRRTADMPRNGDMVGAWIEGDDEMTLKRYYREGDNVRLQPSSPDPSYQPVIRPADRVKIQGRVLAIIRTL